MQNPFKFIFSRGAESALGIDIGPSSIKVVQIEKQKGRAVLKTYGALALGPYAGVEVGRATRLPVEKVAEAIKDILREANTSTKRCGLSIPMSSSLVTVIEVPSTDPKELAQMIPIEARKYIPIPVGEVSLDWSIIPHQEVGESEFELSNSDGTKRQQKSTVLLVAIHNEAISYAQEIVRLTGLEASFFEIEIFSTIRSVLNKEVDPVMIIDMGAGSTKIYIIDRGVLRASHIIARGAQDLTLAVSKALGITVDEAERMKRMKGLTVGLDNEDAMGVMSTTINYTFSEINRVLLNYQKKYNKNISKAILTGGGAVLKGFLEVARQELQTDVVLADPFAKVEAPAFLDKVLKQSGPEFVVSVGLALRRLMDTN
jgi:type IV pilus assembly protein PilM